MSPASQERSVIADGASNCPGCGTGLVESVLQLSPVPTNSCIVIDDPAEARAYPTGALDLVACRGCGLVFNRAFDPSLTEYTPRYEETQSFSATFRRFHETLARELIDRYALHGRCVVEIGCGKGEFLLLLSELGGVHGLGFDPGFRPERLRGPAASRVRVVPAQFPAATLPSETALVCCKMTLEHIADPRVFLSAVRSELSHMPKAALFLMVPNAERIFALGAFEDVYYEHCNYFTAESLARILTHAGLQPTLTTTVFDHQYLCMHAVVAAPRSDSAGDGLPGHESPADIGQLREVLFRARERWKARFALWARTRQRVVLWGSGSKASAFGTKPLSR
jgi:SAM-dependent methyltransferase